ALIGYTLVTFAAGGMADWMPTFFSRVFSVDLAKSGFAVVCRTENVGLQRYSDSGCSGCSNRSWRPWRYHFRRLARRSSKIVHATSVLGTKCSFHDSVRYLRGNFDLLNNQVRILGNFLQISYLEFSSYYVATVLLFLAQLFLWMYSGPVNTILAN